ncbi:hypothetical protein [Natrinema versiforme]|uniref:Uncharacterized protein n=1 Tax=Natrinema versiforme TaxID=88724 RepID=A0A4P8WKI4_9EURY|nr:hypothetical protein [Natrinema versiforme]QCS44047.1 hypothetical protein FEJ81_17480 [Natrinema versiforme]
MVDRPSAVTWSRSASASTAGRLCRYVQVGFFGGLAVLVAGFVVMGVVLSVASGAYEGLAVFALLLLIGGPFSLLYLLPLLEDRTAQSAVGDWMVRAGYDRLSLSRLATSVLVGALAGAVGATFIGLERGGDALVILLYVALLAGCFGAAFLALAVRRP